MLIKLTAQIGVTTISPDLFLPMKLPQKIILEVVQLCGWSHGYTAELTWGNTVDDLIENLNNGYPTSIHISQPTNLFNIKNGKVEWGDWRTLIGGAPHTVTLAGYDPSTDTWLILDPSPYANTDYARWHTDELMEKWGRQFLLYPPRLAMTTLIPDTTPMLPTSTSSATPIATPPTPSVTTMPSQTSTSMPQSSSGTSNP